MSTKRDKKNRDQALRVHLTEDEKSRVAKEAATAGHSISQWVRLLIRKHLKLA